MKPKTFRIYFKQLFPLRVQVSYKVVSYIKKECINYLPPQQRKSFDSTVALGGLVGLILNLPTKNLMLCARKKSCLRSNLGFTYTLRPRDTGIVGHKQKG